jgi:hypothetical protein
MENKNMCFLAKLPNNFCFFIFVENVQLAFKKQQFSNCLQKQKKLPNPPPKPIPEPQKRTEKAKKDGFPSRAKKFGKARVSSFVCLVFLTARSLAL